MAKRAYTGDELDQLRGSSTVLNREASTGQAKNHRLKSCNQPRKVPMNGDVLVTQPNGKQKVLSSTLRDHGKEKRDRAYAKRLANMERDAIFGNKRARFARGATYGDSWQAEQ